MDFTGWDIRCLAREMHKLLPEGPYTFRWKQWVVPIFLRSMKNVAEERVIRLMLIEWDNNQPFREFVSPTFRKMMEEVKRRYPS